MNNAYSDLDDNSDIAPDNAKAAFHSLSPDQILQAVESQGWVCNGSLLALNSYENRVYQVGIEDQAPLIAKFYRPQRWLDAAIQEEHDFTLELAADELPVIAPLANREQQTLFHYAEHRFALYPRQGGRCPELDNPDQLTIIGRLAARIHLHGEQRIFQYRPTLSIKRLGQESVAYLLQEQRLPQGLEASYRALSSQLLTKIEARFAAAGTIESLRLHGDLHLGNILWRDDVPHVVDFDDTCMGPAIQDFWLCLSGDRAYQTARLADVLDGYTQFRDFNPRELYLIEPLRTLRMIHYAAWLARRAEDPAFRAAFPWFYGAQYWDGHILALKEQLALLDEAPLVWD